MTLKEMPRVGGGHGSSHKIHARLHTIESQDFKLKGYLGLCLGYGWGYIGRDLKGGFKPKSGTEDKF